jgi:4-diphosphocytidyl-2C-methyl-D-erythritol kinase
MNDLYKPALHLNGDVERAYEELKSFSPLGVAMTGSGSCVFAIFETAELCRWAKSRYRGKFRAIVSQSVNPNDKKSGWKNPYKLTDEEWNFIEE